MKKKIGFSLIIIMVLFITSGCILDEKLSTKRDMQKYATKKIASDAVVESVTEVTTGLKGNKWTLYLKREPDKKFIVYEYIATLQGVPLRGRSRHSDFGSIWIKDLYDEYIIGKPEFYNIDVKAGNSVYCDNCGNFVFTIDCDNAEEKRAVEDFVSYVRDTGIVFEESSIDVGYTTVCRKN